ncbi:MAG TPA: PilZ domain-containing protein [Thermoanaerobaculaceae bacterium]|nr:PilZ domain-containing protein [Thermoanaerobaculaceae bacterium]HPS79597.1 PilZ domain-containing protein [Thermoanaerobaculaceae bacterium]
MNDSTERREFARVPLDVEVVVETPHARHPARAVNIGELGMRFVKPPGHPMPRGTEVLLDFDLPGDPEPFRILGWVASDSDSGSTPSTSVTFVFHSEAEAERMRRFVSRHRPSD